MKQVVFCPVCGAEADADLRRCPRCGAPFRHEPEVRLRRRHGPRIPWLAILVILATLAALATLATLLVHP